MDADRHVVFQNELKEGSPELTDILSEMSLGPTTHPQQLVTPPLTETERLILETERWLNSLEFQGRFPEAGEDVKVMGVRRDRHLFLTVAIAFVDRFVADARSYFDRKEEMRVALTEYLLGRLQTLDQVSVQLNTLDDPARERVDCILRFWVHLQRVVTVGRWAGEIESMASFH